MAALIPTLDEIEALMRRVVREEMAKTGPATLSTEEAAAFAHRSTRTVRAWIAAGELPAQKRGRSHRILREDLERFLAGGPAPENDPIVATLKRSS
jgi:excisionase family DNA binding protein